MTKVEYVKTVQMHAKTFVGTQAARVLVIQPEYSDKHTPTDYSNDAQILAAFLLENFCNKTLSTLKEILP